ncbi:MAG: M23 family metallopeptidase, partial [Oscillospiraceae bacterium]|nr:M23 family metallopeptidase [Oscillospiraceae bacterium]
MKKFTKSIVSLAVILSFLVGGIADYIPLLDSAVITSEAATESNWMWPTSARTLTSPNSKPNARRWGGVHGGIDIAGATGTNVFASKSGKVIAAQWHNSYGNYVKIQHGDGTYSLYAHMSKIEVKRTDNVKQGEIIGKIGSTGDSTGPHLHFEIRNKNDATINNNPAWRASGINGKSFDGKSKTNWTGSNGGWSGTIKWGEINYVFTPTTLAQPTVKTEKYYGGEKFTITAPSGAYVRYSTNGGKSTGYTNTGKRSVTLDVNFRTTNSLRVQSYQGSTSSAVKTIQSSTVGQVITPVVNYNSAKGTFTISAGSGSSAKEFFYTTNGCNPVVTTAGKAGTCSTHKQICTKKYGGSPVSVSTTSQTTVKAVAIMKGSINSSVRTVQCKPAAPGRP